MTRRGPQHRTGQHIEGGVNPRTPGAGAAADAPGQAGSGVLILTSAKQSTRPYCDFCRHPSNGAKIVAALYDTKTKFGPWAHVCEAHLWQYGSAAEEDATRPVVPAQRTGGLRLYIGDLEPGNDQP